MDLTGLTDFLETQQIGFTSILKYTKNLDPAELKRTLTKHHACMVVIACSQYPIAFTPPALESPDKPASNNKGSFSFNNGDNSTTEDDYMPPTGSFSGKYAYTPRSTSASTPTPKSKKTTTPNPKTKTPISSNVPNSIRNKLQPGGVSKIFAKSVPVSTRKAAYIQRSVSKDGFKTFTYISSEEESDCKEAHDFASEGEGSDGEPVRPDTARGEKRGRKTTPGKKTTPVKMTSPGKGAAKNDRDEIGGGGKKDETGASQMIGTGPSGKVGGTQKGEGSGNRKLAYVEDASDSDDAMGETPTKRRCSGLFY